MISKHNHIIFLALERIESLTAAQISTPSEQRPNVNEIFVFVNSLFFSNYPNTSIRSDSLYITIKFV